MNVHVVAFQHKTPGEGVGGFDWRMTADEVEAIERERVATGFYGPEYEHAIFTVEVPDTLDGDDGKPDNEAVTKYVDGCYVEELCETLGYNLTTPTWVEYDTPRFKFLRERGWTVSGDDGKRMYLAPPKVSA